MKTYRVTLICTVYAKNESKALDKVDQALIADLARKLVANGGFDMTVEEAPDE